MAPSVPLYLTVTVPPPLDRAAGQPVRRPMGDASGRARGLQDDHGRLRPAAAARRATAWRGVRRAGSARSRAPLRHDRAAPRSGFPRPGADRRRGVAQTPLEHVRRSAETDEEPDVAVHLREGLGTRLGTRTENRL